MNIHEIETDARMRLQDEALGRSVFYGCLSLALHAPTPETYGLLRSDMAKCALENATALLLSTEWFACETNEPAAEGTGVKLAEHVRDWFHKLETITLEQWLTAHGQMFGHTVKGVVCPYESEYGQSGLFEQPRRLSKIMGFYSAFGLTTRELERERPDHISCQLEFMDILSRKEAVALELKDHEMWDETRKAVGLFLKDHVGRFGLAFARLLREEDAAGFYGRLADVLFDFLAMECQRVGVPRGSEVLRPRPAEEDGVPMACGDQSDLVQLQVP